MAVQEEQANTKSGSAMGSVAGGLMVLIGIGAIVLTFVLGVWYFTSAAGIGEVRGLDVTILGAALAGLISFLSPCVLPLVPPYLGYLGGTTFDEMTGDGEGKDSNAYARVVAAAVFFVLGFSTVFVSLGAAASVIGQFIAIYKAELAIAAGLIILVFGLHFLGIVKIPLLYRQASIDAKVERASFLGAYVMGLAFAFGWTPCIGPVLATILTFAATEATVTKGMGLLAVYSLGLGIPFILAAVLIGPFMGFMKRFRRHLGVVEKVMGGLLVVTGILFLTGSINTIGIWLLEMFPALQVIG